MIAVPTVGRYFWPPEQPRQKRANMILRLDFLRPHLFDDHKKIPLGGGGCK